MKPHLQYASYVARHKVAWVKPFAAFKRNVRVAYAWEPVIVKPAERLEGATPTRDFIAEGITMKRGLTGAKPERFCFWLFEAMGLRRCDRLDDLFPGSGAVARAWEAWTSQYQTGGCRMKTNLGAGQAPERIGRDVSLAAKSGTIHPAPTPSPTEASEQ